MALDGRCGGGYCQPARLPAGTAESGHRVLKRDAMSNHSGSYMLNSLLTMIERESFFSDIGPQRTADYCWERYSRGVAVSRRLPRRR